jgi:hypothetical protein
MLEHAFEILQRTDGNREKLQAMELFKDTHLVKPELLSNATTIDGALNYIKSKRQVQKKHSSLDSSPDSDDNDQLRKRHSPEVQEWCYRIMNEP